MSVLIACVSVQHLCAWYSWRTEEGLRSPGIGVVDSYEPPYGAGKVTQVLR